MWQVCVAQTRIYQKSPRFCQHRRSSAIAKWSTTNFQKANDAESTLEVQERFTSYYWCWRMLFVISISMVFLQKINVLEYFKYANNYDTPYIFTFITNIHTNSFDKIKKLYPSASIIACKSFFNFSSAFSNIGLVKVGSSSFKNCWRSSVLTKSRRFLIDSSLGNTNLSQN